MASYLHHTATTVYPCCVPTLGDSTGASCVGLATAKIKYFAISTMFSLKYLKNYYSWLIINILPKIIR